MTTQIAGHQSRELLEGLDREFPNRRELLEGFGDELDLNLEGFDLDRSGRE